MTSKAVTRFQEVFTDSDRRFSLLAIIALCVAGGVGAGAYVAILSPLIAVVLLAALVGGLLMLRDIQWGLIAVVGLICLLPFGALPFKIGFTPTFLDLALIAVFFVWAVRIARGESRDLIGTQLGLPVVVFMLLACASFVAGLAHSSLSSYAIRHFAELLLAIAMFFVVINVVRTRQQVRVLVLAILLAGFGAAAIGVFLYIIPSDWSIRLLSVLGRVGYPTGSGVLRYVEDNPELPLRAISTSTDPNVLGGMLILVTTLTAAQVFSRTPILPRSILVLMALVDVMCLYLTYSRGSMVGLAAGLAVLALVKYRRLVPAMAMAGILLLLLPQTQSYVQHFVEGIQLQDLATLMRLGEYKDALILISRHPWIGVGFVGTPESSLYIGVSMVYLLIAEEMGLIGLASFLLIVVLFFRQVWRAWSTIQEQEGLASILLGSTAALVGILVGGVFDHYFFNLSFPHSVTIFWMFLGLAMTTVQIGEKHGVSTTLALSGTSPQGVKQHGWPRSQ